MGTGAFNAVAPGEQTALRNAPTKTGVFSEAQTANAVPPVIKPSTGGFGEARTARPTEPQRAANSQGDGAFGTAEVRSPGAIATRTKPSPAGFGEARTAQPPVPQRPEAARSDSGFGAATALKPSVETKPSVSGGSFGNAVGQAMGERPQVEQPRPSEVEVLYKPRPAYTEEARKLKVEGEVLVEVLFSASGHIKVLHVVKGLGHGLDETAVQAASKIRFKPAERDGRAVDSIAIARITFQLAY
jgi:TonB family protein